MQKLLIYGAGSGSREILLAVRDINRHSPTWEPVGFVDDDPAKAGRQIDGLTVHTPDQVAEPGIHAICGIMDSTVRRRMTEELIEARGQVLATIIHPSVLTGDDLIRGPGLVMMPGVKASVEVRLGKGVFVLWNSMLGHDLQVGDYATILTGATILANCVIGAGATVGGGSVLNSGALLEERSMVGVGTTLIRKIGAGQTVMSMPRMVKWKR